MYDNGYRDAKGRFAQAAALAKASSSRSLSAMRKRWPKCSMSNSGIKKPSPEIRYADYVVSGMGKDDTVDGMSKIKRFKKEDFPKILVSVNMLDTGFDCPEVVNLVFARFTKSADPLPADARSRHAQAAHEAGFHDV